MMRRHKQKNWLEWCVFSIGLVLVGGIVGYLAVDLWRSPSGPPKIVIHLGEVTSGPQGYEVSTMVRNGGFDAAEGVEVEVVLEPQDGEDELSGYVIQFLPRGSTRRGVVTFTHDPRTAKKMTARVRGYATP